MAKDEASNKMKRWKQAVSFFSFKKRQPLDLGTLNLGDHYKVFVKVA